MKIRRVKLYTGSLSNGELGVIGFVDSEYGKVFKFPCNSYSVIGESDVELMDLNPVDLLGVSSYEIMEMYPIVRLAD